MNYQNHSKHRKMRHAFSRIASGLSFSFLHLPVAYRIVFLWIVFVLASTAFPWFSIGNDASFTPYSGLLGYIGYVFVLVAFFPVASMLSPSFGESVKNRTGILFSDYSIVTFFGVVNAFLVLVSIAFMKNLVFFTKDVSYHDAPVYAFIGAVLVVLGGILAYRDAKREVLSTLYIENSQTSDALFREYEAILSKKPTEKKNMSLPV